MQYKELIKDGLNKYRKTVNSIIQSIDLRILRVAVIVVEMENKGTRMFTNHIHNGPSQKPSQQHSECMNCGARPRWMLESWDEERAPGVQRGLRPLTGAEGHPRVHCRIQCMQVEPSQNAPPLRSGGQHLWGGVPEGPASAPGASQSGYIGEQSKVKCTLL